MTDPFVGAGPIQSGQALFGRDLEINQLTNLLIARRIVLLHSPSGAGKSSLINAGLLPALQQKKFSVLRVIRVNKAVPAEVLAVSDPDRINRYIISTLQSLEDDPAATVRLSPGELSTLCLADYIGMRRNQGSPDRPLLLIFDQFEEILTADPIDLPVKQNFFQQAGEVLDDRRTWALFSMREDFVGGLDPYLKFLPTQLSARFRLDLLSKEAAEQAIRRPALKEKPPEGGIYNTFSEDAASLLAEDLRTMLVQQESGQRLPKAGPYVEPVQLQVVCKRLWENRGSAERVEIKDVEAQGTVNDALAGYYADCVKAIAAELKDRGVREWMIRDWFDRKLITAGGIRGQVMMGEGQTEKLDNLAIQRLMSYYLVREERRRGVTWYELAHDRLVDPIRQDNKRWREVNLSRFHNRAVRYVEEGHSGELLLNPDEIKEMEQWVNDHQGDLTYEEEELLEFSRNEQRDRQTHSGNLTLSPEGDLSQLGWGVVFCESAPPNLRDALSDLLRLRQGQTGGLYRELTYRNNPPESAAQFLARYGAVAGLVDPDTLPYYLLLVGSLTDIPLDFQYQMDQHYAVGRLWLENPEDLRSYARSVALVESGKVKLPRRAALFIPTSPDDIPTKVLNEGLAPALLQNLHLDRLQPNWELQDIRGANATRASLQTLMRGAAPALLAVFSHGMVLQEGEQDPGKLGALVTAEWPGPRERVKITSEMLFGVNDVPDDASLMGTVALISANFSAGGAPGQSDYAFIPSYNYKKQYTGAQQLLAHLPQRLLGHPKGGALAVIAHIDGTFLLERGLSEGPLFAELLRRMMEGSTVGAAMDVMNARYDFYASRLSDLLRQQTIDQALGKQQASGSIATPKETQTLLTGLIDARNYIILGDPAVHLPLANTPEEVLRPALPPLAIPEGVEPGEAAVSESYLSPPVQPRAVMPRVSQYADTTQAPSYPDLTVKILPGESGQYQVTTRLFISSSSQLELNSEPMSLPAPDFGRFAALENDPTSYGKELTSLLFGLPDDSPIGALFSQAQSFAQSQGLPLRLRLAIAHDPAGLQDLHWETLRDPQGEQALVNSANILFSRFIELDTLIRLRPRPASLRVLVVADDSNSDSGVIQRALQWKQTQWKNTQPSLAIDVITAMPGDLLHTLTSDSGADIIFLVSNKPRADGENLLNSLSAVQKEQGPLPRVVGLIFLPSSVEMAADSSSQLAEAVIRVGVPAVIAISEGTGLDTITSFLSSFIQELSRDGVVDRAAAIARGYLVTLDLPDAWRPVLFSAVRDNLLWTQTTTEGESPAPFLAPPPPVDIVERPAERDQLVERLLRQGSAQPVALVGGPGSGKSVLAAAACADERVIKKFTGGILWLSLGQQPLTPARLFDTLTGTLTGQSPRSSSLAEARALFIQVTQGAPVLLVLDDVCEPGDLAPFLPLPAGCTCLVTTERRSLLPEDSIAIGPLEAADAARLLASNLAGANSLQAELDALAARLGCWPFALRQANNILKERIAVIKQSLPDALAYLARSLDRRGIDVLEVKPVLAKALQPLEPDAAIRYAELSIFPPDEDLPAPAIERLWSATAALDAAAARALLDSFFDRSLLQPGMATGGLRAVPGLLDFAGSFWIDAPGVHQALLDACRKAYNLTDWTSLPAEETYLRQHLAYHLAHTNNIGQLEALLRDPAWIQDRLRNAGPAAVLREYHYLPRTAAAAIVGDALRLSAGALTLDASQLPAQLLGRLYSTRSELSGMLAGASRMIPAGALQPVFPSLISPDGPLEASFLAPQESVTCVALTSKGDRAVLGTSGGLYTLDLETGETICWEDSGAVSSLAVHSNGQVIAAWEDGRLESWSLETGALLNRLEEADPKRSRTCALALSEPGLRPAAGQPAANKSPVQAAGETGPAALLVGEAGGNIRYYNLDTGEKQHSFLVHKAAVQALALVPGGALALFADGAWEIRSLADGSAAGAGKLSGQPAGVVFSTGNVYLLATQTPEGIALVNPLQQDAAPVLTLRSPAGSIQTLAALPNGQFLAAGGGMLQAWDAGGEPVWSQPTAAVANLLAVSPDGQRAVTAGGGPLVQVWAPDRGKGWSGTSLRGQTLALGIIPEAKLAAALLDDASIVNFDLESGRQQVYRDLKPDTITLTKGIKTTSLIYAMKGVETAAKKRFNVLLSANEGAIYFSNPGIKSSYRLVFPENPHALAAVDPLGLLAVFALSNDKVTVWDIGLARTFELRVASRPTALAVSPSAKWFAAGMEHGSWMVWAYPNYTSIASRFRSKGGQSVSSLALSENGQILLTATGRSVQVWHVHLDSGSSDSNRKPAFEIPLKTPLAAPDDLVPTILSLTPDGRLAAAAAGSSVYLLDVQNGSVLSCFFTDAPIRYVAISPDGQYIAAADQSKSIHILRRASAVNEAPY